MPVKVKICGITNLEDGLAAAEAGADALGFIFHEASPRYLTIEKAAGIIRPLPPAVLKVGVFVNAPAGFIVRAAKECGLDLLQFHGVESPEFCSQFSLKSMKAFQMKEANSLKLLPQYQTYAWLLDAWSPSRAGGSGETFNWDLAVQARDLGRPIFLAGGLKPENVAQAINQVRPYGVDVSSGVETRPGKKDHAKVREFIRAVRAAKPA